MPELMKEISFAKLDQGMQMPHLLDIQTRAFESLLQVDAAAHERLRGARQRHRKPPYLVDRHHLVGLST